MVRFLLVFACAIASFLYGTDTHELPEPYRDIELLPFDPEGWYGNAHHIEPLIKKYNVKVIVEIGSWLGLSTRHMASLLPEGGKVYAIDHWLGSKEHQPGQSAYYPMLPDLYRKFLSNVIHAGLTNKIVPIKMASLDAAQLSCFKNKEIIPDLIYIDAGHEEEDVYADLVAWYPYVQEHGVLCGDDWNWPGVCAAVTEFARERNLKIIEPTNDQIFWRLQE